MSNENLIAKMGKYGIVGVMLSLIMLAAGSMWYVFKLATNHSEDFTKVIMENTAAIGQLNVTTAGLKVLIENKVE